MPIKPSQFLATWLPPDRLKGWAAECLAALDALLFPPQCVVCETWQTRGPFCDGCRAELIEGAGPACWRCALPLGEVAARAAVKGCGECRRRKLGFDAAVALGPYQGPIREVCLRLKYERDAWLAPWVGRLVVEARRPALEGFLASCRRPPVVVPVPLHWLRRWQRRYNQADELAEGIARGLGLASVDALKRVRPTAKLAGRGRVERAAMVKGAFRPRRRARLAGRDAILVDDVLTTGATCGAAARALKKAGAGRVLAVVVGRAEGRV